MSLPGNVFDSQRAQRDNLATSVSILRRNSELSSLGDASTKFPDHAEVSC